MDISILSISLSLIIPLSTSLSAQQFSFQSNESKTQLIELYTSQGCSSCPPADKKLSKLLASDELWNSIIPIAFHVDYWNYLGWKDIYSNSQSTNRQRQHFAKGNVNSLYTPQFIIDGSEWRGFFRGSALTAPVKQRAGKLNLNWDLETSALSMKYDNQTKQYPDRCYFSLLSFEDAVKIHSGENENLVLKQSFSSLAIIEAALEINNDHYFCKADSKAFQAYLQAPSKDQKFALVGWVSNANETHLQATGGWL